MASHPRERADSGLPVHGGDVIAASRRLGIPVSAILDFSSNLNPLGPSPKALEALADGLPMVGVYPDAEYAELREALSGRLGGGELRASNFVVGAGSSELIHLAARACCRPGRETVVVEPTFSEYERAVGAVEGRVRAVRVRPDFRVDAESVAAAIGEQTCLVFLCNPNNPTSLTVPRGAVEIVLERAEKAGALLVVDEDCIEFCGGTSSFLREAARSENLLVLRSFTKVYGLAGLRVGFGAASARVIRRLEAVKAPWTVSNLAQAAALAALEDVEHLEAARRLVEVEKGWLAGRLSAIEGVSAVEPEANYVLVNVGGAGLTGGELKSELLARNHILVRDCANFKGLGSHFIRVAVRGREDNRRLVEALRGVVEGRLRRRPDAKVSEP